MRQIVMVFTVLFTMSATLVFGAEVSKDTSAKINQVSDKASKLSAGKVGDYAKDVIGTAQISLSAAKLAMAAGNEKQALQKLELADLQLTIAEAKTAEKEADEQAALKRAELKKLEAQLDGFSQEGGK